MFQALSYQSYLHSPMTNWSAHAGEVHPAMPGCNVPILNIAKAQALWQTSPKPAKKMTKDDKIQAMLHCPMCDNKAE